MTPIPPIPDPVERYAQLLDCGKSHLAGELVRTEQRIAKLTADLSAMTEDRDLWQGEHNEDCPNAAMVAKLTAEVERLKEQHAYFLSLYEPQHKQALEERDEARAENTRLKAPVSDEECVAFENSYGEKLLLNYVDYGLSEFVASRATRTPPQEGQ